MPKVAEKVRLEIHAPNFKTAKFKITGTAPLVIHKFSQKAREQMMAAQSAGSAGKSKRKREPKDFEKVFNEARHIATQGWDGFPASALRSAMIAACRATDAVMTRAKMAIFVKADGLSEDGTGLIRILGKVEKHEGYARNQTGVADIRVRPMFKSWHAFPLIQFDSDMISAEDVANLLMRAGMQVGICEGRPFSKQSNGCGWGTFTVEEK